MIIKRKLPLTLRSTEGVTWNSEKKYTFSFKLVRKLKSLSNISLI